MIDTVKLRIFEYGERDERYYMKQRNEKLQEMENGDYIGSFDDLNIRTHNDDHVRNGHIELVIWYKKSFSI